MRFDPENKSTLEDFGLTSLPIEWGAPVIGDLLAEDRGISVGVMYPGDHCDHGIPLVKAGDLKSNWINPNPPFRITPEKHYEYRRTELEGGELLISLVGNAGQTAVVPSEMKGWNVARAVAVVRLSNEINPHFVKYALQSPALGQLMKSWCNTTVQETLNLKEIKRLPIPFPEITEQKAIAQILGTLDDKIELNRKTNDTLEAMAKALFKSWFVDFDPVRAKAEGRSTGLPAEISDLFPDSFEDSELGEIPSGWVVANIGEVTDLVTKGTTPTSIGGGFSSEGIPFYKVESISDEGHIIPGKCAFIDEQSDALLARSRIQEGDILFSIAGTIGRVAQVTSFDIPANTNQALAIARPNRERISSSLLFYFLRERSRIDLALSRTVQSVQANFSLSELRSIPLALPKQSSRIALEDILDTIRKKVSSNQRNSFTVAAVRDALLPKLISGEIRIPDAEKMLGEVGI